MSLMDNIDIKKKGNRWKENETGQRIHEQIKAQEEKPKSPTSI